MGNNMEKEGGKKGKKTAEDENEPTTAPVEDEKGKKVKRTKKEHKKKKDKKDKHDDASGGDAEESTSVQIRYEPVEDYYEIKEKLGEGAFAEVFKGVNKKTGDVVAIKCIDTTKVEPEEKVNLDREIEVMKSIDHPNVIRLYDVFSGHAHGKDNMLSLVMELAPKGELLERIIEQGSFSEADTIKVMKQVLEALAYLHKKNIAHRDLKPENLLCAGDDDNLIVKISDFGLSKSIANNEQLKTIVGTPDYASPEVVEMSGDAYTVAVDMWSIGVIAYVLLTGYHPFSSDNVNETFQRIKAADVQFSSDLFGDISDNAVDFIKRCLEVNPASRLTADDALKHPWIAGKSDKTVKKPTKQLSMYMTKRKESRIPK